MKAVIPVRKGSVRVKNKNIRPFCGKNLLIYKIEQLKRIGEIEEVVVNSDCDDMLLIAQKYGATAIKRNAYLASSEAPINSVWKNIALTMDSDIIVYANATSPLIQDRSIEDCINLYNTLNLFEREKSLNTATTIKEFLWMNGAPVNYRQEQQPRSQDLPLVFHPNFGINIVSKKIMFEKETIISNNFEPFFLGKIESIDIDDEEDFLIAEMLFKKQIRS
jgi:CMP-N-acetylneuraminic acid synthetase